MSYPPSPPFDLGDAPEAVVRHSNGYTIRTAPHPVEVDYVRVCDPAGVEIGYWTTDEIAEDPADVIGAIMGAVIQGV